ncbi:cupin domain-containing protein [Kitasatospora sp. GP82]|uniref:cupin domain-containing protein n=1 Tax=Kitasatospora sp. GP82 TaxID=3035089 RepID=UPI002474EE7D|nr:cupin domain-containing protein [Kitasatospora sp. GP82]MDH6123924.1 quercetin dioxygenase-like cupin family protein [Kitasatospora sp. GP82]
MPVIRTGQATVHEIHGARFLSYATPASGSSDLCAWRLEIAPGTPGVEHTISHEEILHVLSGSPVVTLDGHRTPLAPGDTAIAPAGTRLKVDNPGDQPAHAWVTARTGLRATLADGSALTPPWAN